MKICVVGCGRWGSCIAWYLDKIGHSVTLYGRESSEHIRQFRQTRTNGLVTLPQSVELSTDLQSAVACDVVVVSIASQALSSLALQLNELGVKNTTVVLCMKGIEISTGRRLSQIISDACDKSVKVAVWLGPGHVQEFCSGIPNCMVIDSEDDEVKRLLVDSFSSELIRFYYGQDLVGNEIGAASKNVIGIAAGMLDGLHLTTLKGALMSRGTREIARLIKAAGGNELSAYGLCHLGDYEATVFSPYSHNRSYGEAFIRGERFDALAEGYYTVKALVDMASRLGVDLPICNAVYELLYENGEPQKVLSALFSRSLKNEF